MSEYIPMTDVSVYQGNINWDKVLASGITHTYIRLCNGITLDTNAIRNAETCRNLGIKFGFYCYWRPMFRADRQAKMLADYSKQYGATLMPMLDIEAHDDQKPRVIVDKLLRSVTVLTERFGKPPVVYTAAWFWNSRVNSIKFNQCPLWVARYNHYSLSEFKDPAHKIPVDPQEWDEYALSHRKPDPCVGWGINGWVAWQFSAGFNQTGYRYGMASRDLDLNIVKTEQMSRILVSISEAL